jgi:hypothetical protein
MKPNRRARIIALFILAALAWTPAGLFGCGTACPFGAGTVLPCCRPSGPAPVLRTASCCEALAAAAPIDTSQAVRPPLSVFLAAAVPVSTSSQAVFEPPINELPSTPPLLYEGIGLYTLNATFLI